MAKKRDIARTGHDWAGARKIENGAARLRGLRRQNGRRQKEEASKEAAAKEPPPPLTGEKNRRTHRRLREEHRKESGLENSTIFSNRHMGYGNSASSQQEKKRPARMKKNTNASNRGRQMSHIQYNPLAPTSGRSLPSQKNETVAGEPGKSRNAKRPSAENHTPYRKHRRSLWRNDTWGHSDHAGGNR